MTARSQAIATMSSSTGNHNQAEECGYPDKDCGKLIKRVSKFYGPRIEMHRKTRVKLMIDHRISDASRRVLTAWIERPL